MRKLFAAAALLFLSFIPTVQAASPAWTAPTIQQAFLVVSVDGDGYTVSEVVDWGHPMFGWAMDGYFITAYERDYGVTVIGVDPLRPMNLNRDEGNGRR